MPEARSSPSSNGTHGTIRFGGLTQFKTACRSVATVLNNYPQAPGDPLLIIAFDAPFYGLAPLLTAAARRCLVNVARSTAPLHDPGDRSRVQWERNGLHAAVAGGALAELVIDGLTGYTAQPRHPASLAAAISRALACDPAGRARLRAASRRLAVTRYDHAQAVAAFCAEVAPWTVTTGKQGMWATHDDNGAPRRV